MQKGETSSRMLLIGCIIDLGKLNNCFLTVTKTDLDITMYERERRQLFRDN